MSTRDVEALLDGDGCDQATAIRDGQVSCGELTDAAIARIESLNPKLNCVVAERFEAAREEAAALDRHGAFEGPLAGVPVLLKDLGQQLAGLTQTDGSRAQRSGPPSQDSAFTARYRAAGMIVLGKTSSPEFGNHSTSEALVHGPCRNPWDTTRTAGGSSGGAAAAVAARMVTIAGAGDGAGSIRIPSSCCGTFGLKPSRGRVAVANNAGGALDQLAVTHAITRSVRDSATVLDLSLAGSDAPFHEQVGADPGTLRIGLSTAHTMGGQVAPECVAAAQSTAELLRSLGHDVEQAAPALALEALTDSMLAVWATANAEGARGLSEALGRPLRDDELEPTTWELIEHAQRLTDADMQHAAQALAAASAQIGEFFNTYDLWLTPTLAQPPLPLGVLNRSVGSAAGWWSYDLDFNPWCPLANIAGAASASLPLHVSADGLPIGTMLTAGRGQDALLIRVCAQLERAQPWAERRP